MSTAIEKYLFGKYGTHAVVGLSLSVKKLTLGITPWKYWDAKQTFSPTLVAEFNEMSLDSIDTTYCDEEDKQLPWDIIGFDCRDLQNGRWRFVMHTDGGEYGFVARWPVLSRAIYVRLLNEGVDVMRPTMGVEMQGNRFKLLPTANYDPEDEEWEFPPGTIVKCHEESKDGIDFLVALQRAD